MKKFPNELTYEAFIAEMLIAVDITLKTFKIKEKEKFIRLVFKNYHDRLKTLYTEEGKPK